MANTPPETRSMKYVFQVGCMGSGGVRKKEYVYMCDGGKNKYITKWLREERVMHERITRKSVYEKEYTNNK